MSCSDSTGPDCAEALDKLYLFLDHEIDDASCEQIRMHVEQCSGCLNEYDIERVVKSLVSRSCHERAPEPLREKVMLSIRTVQVQITES